MQPKYRSPIHPNEVLKEEFQRSLDIERITEEIAATLARELGTTAEF